MLFAGKESEVNNTTCNASSTLYWPLVDARSPAPAERLLRTLLSDVTKDFYEYVGM